MSKEYHYLVAGLPDLLLDDSKLLIDLGQFRDLLAENLSSADMEIVSTFFYRFDNRNILARLKDPECGLDPRGNLSPDRLDQLLQVVREGSFATDITGIPEYLNDFLTAYYLDTPLPEGKSRELHLSELYYEYATLTDNRFVRDWYAFEKNMTNLVTASQCKKYNLPAENQLIGQGEIIEKLKRSNARDFGLDNEFPHLDEILKAIDESNLKDFELRLDRIKWKYLDEEVFFFYFTIERLFSFLVKLVMIERWLALDKETGQQLFNELLSNLETGYTFPDEFKLKK